MREAPTAERKRMMPPWPRWSTSEQSRESPASAQQCGPLGRPLSASCSDKGEQEADQIVIITVRGTLSLILNASHVCPTKASVPAVKKLQEPRN